MSAAAAAASVELSPEGVRLWLSQPSRCAERDLVEHLLASGPAPVDVRALSARCGRPLPELVRALFHLNRTGSLVVGGVGQVPQGDHTLAGLEGDLRSLIPAGASAALADGEGLCLAACGWDRRAAERAAALAAAAGAPPAHARWWFGAGEITLAATQPPDPRSPGWVRMARRLVHACGPLAPGVRR